MIHPVGGVIVDDVIGVVVVVVVVGVVVVAIAAYREAGFIFGPFAFVLEEWCGCCCGWGGEGAVISFLSDGI